MVQCRHLVGGLANRHCSRSLTSAYNTSGGMPSQGLRNDSVQTCGRGFSSGCSAWCVVPTHLLPLACNHVVSTADRHVRPCQEAIPHSSHSSKHPAGQKHPVQACPDICSESESDSLCHELCCAYELSRFESRRRGPRRGDHSPAYFRCSQIENPPVSCRASSRRIFRKCL